MIRFSISATYIINILNKIDSDIFPMSLQLVFNVVYKKFWLNPKSVFYKSKTFPKNYLKNNYFPFM